MSEQLRAILRSAVPQLLGAVGLTLTMLGFCGCLSAWPWALAACLGVDYIAISKIDKGAPLELVYPNELLVIPSPVAIFKDSARMDAAKTFVEYLLGPEAQQAIANAGTVPVRKDVQMPEKYNLPSPEDTMASGIKVNYGEIMREREVSVDRFSKLFGKNGQ